MHQSLVYQSNLSIHMSIQATFQSWQQIKVRMRQKKEKATQAATPKQISWVRIQNIGCFVGMQNKCSETQMFTVYQSAIQLEKQYEDTVINQPICVSTNQQPIQVCFTQSATSTSISVKKHLIVNECYWGTQLFIAQQSWCSTECVHQTVDCAISAKGQLPS